MYFSTSFHSHPHMMMLMLGWEWEEYQMVLAHLFRCEHPSHWCHCPSPDVYRNTKLQDECLLFQQSLFPLQNINIFGLGWFGGWWGGWFYLPCAAIFYFIIRILWHCQQHYHQTSRKSATEGVRSRKVWNGMYIMWKIKKYNRNYSPSQMYGHYYTSAETVLLLPLIKDDYISGIASIIIMW